MDLVEVRIVNASMSHEADIVIVDFTSAENAGFITNKELVCVATTRARHGNIFILNPAAARGEHLKRLTDDAKRCLHLVEGFNWGKYVDSACLCNGHHKPFCKRTEHESRICGNTGHGARRYKLRRILAHLHAEVSTEELNTSYYEVDTDWVSRF